MHISLIYLDISCAAEVHHLSVATVRLALSCHGYSVSQQMIQEHCDVASPLEAIRSILAMIGDDFIEGDEKPIYASFLKLLKVGIQGSHVKPSAHLAEFLQAQRSLGATICLVTVFPLHVSESLVRRLNFTEGVHYDQLISCAAHHNWMETPPTGGIGNASIKAFDPSGLRVAIAGCGFAQAELKKAHPDLMVSHYTDLISHIQCA
jgi:hypothetical protein